VCALQRYRSPALHLVRSSPSASRQGALDG